MSSRNRYLNPDERIKASEIFKSLLKTQGAFQKGESSVQNLIHIFRSEIEKISDFEIEYCEIRDADSLEIIKAVDRKNPNQKLVLLVAIHLGSTRLIDNLELN